MAASLKTALKTEAERPIFAAVHCSNLSVLADVPTLKTSSPAAILSTGSNSASLINPATSKMV